MTISIFDHGIVKKIKGDMAFVEIGDGRNCEQCGARMICAPDSRHNPLNAKVGQKVVVTESHGLILKLLTIQYGLPLLGFIIGVIATYLLDLSIPGVAAELVSFLSGMVGLAVSSVVSWKWAKRASVKQHIFYEISKINSED